MAGMTDRDLDIKAEALAEQLGGLASIQATTWNATRNQWGLPYTTVATSVPVDVATLDALRDEYFTGVAQRLNIAPAQYRLITLPRTVLQNFPAFRQDWRIVVGANVYQVAADPATDETEAALLQVHCRKQGTSVGP